MKAALLILGRGIGQVMFQNNALSGLLMLAGLFLNSWQMALLAIAGNVVSTLAAYFSGYNREDIRNGLYGFNGTLVGIAIGVFMPVTVVSLLLLVAGSCLSAWIARLFSLQRLVSGFTAPFIVSVWILLAVCSWMTPSLLLPSGDAVAVQTLSFLQAFCLNIGQVMFQGNTVLAGLFFLLGIMVNSRINGFYTILGALLPIPFALLLGMDYAALNAGLMGYNGVLCAIALGDKTWRGGVWAVVAVLLSVLFQIGGMEWGITTLTAPFVVAVWIVSGLQKLDKKSGYRN
jgi:urea transporter